MAGTTVVTRQMETAGSTHETTVQLNKVIDDLELLRASASAGGVVAVTELMADHATTKVTVDQLEALAEELGVDHATTKVTVDQLETLAEELAADHATSITLATELKLDLNAAQADLTAIRAAIVGITAKLDADGGVTGTDYASLWNPAALTITTIAASPPATLSATTAITSGPVALSASTAITSGPATLSAAVPTGTSIDAAGDLLAAKVANDSGTVIA